MQPLGGRHGRSKLFLLLCAATLFTISLFYLRLPSRLCSSSTISASTSHHRHCSSRSQYPLFLPPHLPSPAFSAAWRRYQHLHHSCTASKNLNVAFSSYRSAADDNDNRDPCNYLVYLESPEHVGLGNKLLSLASAFTYALLTDRVLLIDRRRNLDSLLCEPFDATNTSWRLPPDFPYAAIDNAPTLADLDPDRIFANFSDGDAAPPLSQPSPPPLVLRLDLHHDRRGQDDRFFCEDVQRFLASSSKWVGWTSNQYFVTELFTMPMFFPRLNAMFPMLDGGTNPTGNVRSAADVAPNTGGGVFTTLSRLLFLPSDSVWEIVIRHYNTYLADASAIAGVQVRLHGHRDIAGFEPSVSQNIHDCLANVAGALPNSTSGNETEMAVLVASLNGGYARDLRRRYNEAAVPVRVHTASSMVVQRNTEKEIRMALAEMWLLSMSDKLVTSAFSTFGYIAQGVRGRKPYILNLEEGGGEKATAPCALAASVEPCTHYPVMLQQCGRQQEKSAGQAAWMAAHIRPCQDYPAGMQIVPRIST